jgi:hypothetical protein
MATFRIAHLLSSDDQTIDRLCRVLLFAGSPPMDGSCQDEFLDPGNLSGLFQGAGQLL